MTQSRLESKTERQKSRLSISIQQLKPAAFERWVEKVESKESPYGEDAEGKVVPIISDYPLDKEEKIKKSEAKEKARQVFQIQFNQLLDNLSKWGEWGCDITLISQEENKEIADKILQEARKQNRPILIRRNQNEFVMYGEQKGDSEEKIWGFTPIIPQSELNLNSLPFDKGKVKWNDSRLTLSLVLLFKKGSHHQPKHSIANDSTRDGIATLRERFFLPEYSGNQESIYFETIKEKLEKIVIRLPDKDISLAKRKFVYEYICQRFKMCGPGLYTHVENGYFQLYSEMSLTRWLADFRTKLILDYAQKYNEEHKIPEGDEIHSSNVFLAYAANEGWTPIFSIDKIKESFAVHTGINENHLLAFDSYFRNIYQPNNIRKHLELKITEMFDTLFKQFGFDTKEWNHIQSDYNRLIEKIENIVGPVNAYDIFDLNEDGTQFRLLDPNKRNTTRIIAPLCNTIFSPDVPSYIYFNRITNIYHLLIKTEDKIKVGSPAFTDDWAEIITDELPQTISRFLKGIKVSEHQRFLQEMLWIFILHKQPEKIKLVLEAKGNVNIRFQERKFPLLAALQSNDIDTVNVLLEAKANLNLISGRSFLEREVTKFPFGNPKIVTALLNANADPNSLLDDKQTSLLELTITGKYPGKLLRSFSNVNIAIALIKGKADFNLESVHHKKTLLELALTTFAPNDVLTRTLMEAKANPLFQYAFYFNFKNTKMKNPIKQDEVKCLQLLSVNWFNVKSNPASLCFYNDTWDLLPEDKYLFVFSKLKEIIPVQFHQAFLQELLVNATGNASISRIQFALDAKADPNLENISHIKPIEKAIQVNADIVRILLEMKATLPMITSDGKSMLESAILGNVGFDTLRTLINAKADVNGFNASKKSMLELLIIEKQSREPQNFDASTMKKLQIILEAKANLTAENEEKISLLECFLTKYNEPALIKEMIKYAKDPIILTKALFAAFKHNRPYGVIEKLIDAKADLQTPAYEKNSLFEIAIQYQSSPMVDKSPVILKLIEAKAYPQQSPTILCDIATHNAMPYADKLIWIKGLLYEKADPFLRVDNSISFLDWIVANNDKEFMNAILDSKVSPNKEIGNVPLLFYCIQSPAVTELLLEAKANLESVDSDKNTPLMHAVLKGNIKTVEVLLERKANINSMNQKGENVLTLASKIKPSELKEDLKKLLLSIPYNQAGQKILIVLDILNHVKKNHRKFDESLSKELKLKNGQGIRVSNIQQTDLKALDIQKFEPELQKLIILIAACNTFTENPTMSTFTLVRDTLFKVAAEKEGYFIAMFSSSKSLSKLVEEKLSQYAASMTKQSALIEPEEAKPEKNLTHKKPGG